MKPTVASALCGLAFTIASGCAGLDEPDAEVTAETSSELSVYSWGSRGEVGLDRQEAYRGGAVANLNGVGYIVHSGACPSYNACGGDSSRDLWWTYQTPSGVWANDRKIGVQQSGHRVSMAAFNGSLYMLHSGSDTSSTQVWVARFNPATQTWSQDSRLSYSSRGGAPAMAVHNGVLRIVGVNPTTNQLWTAVMSADGSWSAAAQMPGHYSASRVSAAEYNGLYYIAHRAGSGNAIVYNAFDGWSWGADQYIYANGGAAIQGAEPAIASNNGYLHLVHRVPGGSSVWWTYFDGYSWPAEQTIPGHTSLVEPALGQSTWGLVLITADKEYPGGDDYRRLYNTMFF